MRTFLVGIFCLVVVGFSTTTARGKTAAKEKHLCESFQVDLIKTACMWGSFCLDNLGYKRTNFRTYESQQICLELYNHIKNDDNEIMKTLKKDD